MIALIDDIDETIHDCVAAHQYGLARLLMDDSGTYPATYADSAGKFVKIAPDDKKPIITYHRLMDGDIEESETHSFGRSAALENSQRVRMVVLVAFSEGESVIDQIIESMPLTLTNVDYKSIVVDPAMTLIRDRTSIWEQEFSNAYADKYQLRFNIYALEYTIKYITCQACVA